LASTFFRLQSSAGVRALTLVDAKRLLRSQPVTALSEKHKSSEIQKAAGASPPMPGISSQQAADGLHDASERHLLAVAGSLRWASESAARGNYRDALGWLHALEAAGEELTHEYSTNRSTWLRAAETQSESVTS
jgi:hypothetical protein